MKLYHFRDATYGLRSISERRLKIARIMELNDPFEFLGINLKDRTLRAAMYKTKKKLSENNGILCFSKNWENPVQWSHYSDHHRGICLEFEISDDFCEKVTYVATRLKSTRPIDFEMMKKILSTKFSHWAYEQEYRAFVGLDHSTKDGELYFMNFNNNMRLTSVIVGHASKITRKDVDDALGDLKTEVSAFKARAAFTKFDVVRNENAALWI